RLVVAAVVPGAAVVDDADDISHLGEHQVGGIEQARVAIALPGRHGVLPLPAAVDVDDAGGGLVGRQILAAHLQHRDLPLLVLAGNGHRADGDVTDPVGNAVVVVGDHAPGVPGR